MNPVLQALLIGLPATVLGFLAWWRSRRVDAIAEQSGAVTETRAGTAQIIEGLNQLIDNLQEDNAVVREGFRFLTQRLDEITKERDALRAEVAELRRRYGQAGD